MSWVTVIWSMTASACLTLALVNAMVWFKQRGAWGHLLFTGLALGIAAIAGSELALFRATSPEAWATTLRWSHVAVLITFVSLAWFVRLYLNAGSSLLAWTACGARTLSLVLNFSTGANLNYREVVGLSLVPLLGERVVVAAGRPNPWMWVGQFSLLLLLAFLIHAAWDLWRRGLRRRALVVGGSTSFFTVAAAAQIALAVFRYPSWPITPSLFFLGVVAAMCYELSSDVARAAHLASELRESELQMTLAAAAANLGMWFRDVAGREVWATDQWRVLFGFPQSEPLDLDSLWTRVHPDDRERVQRALAAAGEGDGRYETEYRVILPDGRTRWINSRGMMSVDGGQPLRLRAVAMDVTDRKEAELDAQASRREVTHLTRVASLGELSATLAHELNQPLTAILSNAQAAQRFLASDPPDLAEIRDILQDIVAADERASDVIQRLRDLLQKRPFQPQVLQASDLIRDVLRLMRADLIARSIVVVTDVAADLPPVRGDRVQLQQVLINLVLNGCDAMADTAVNARTLTIGTSLDAGGGTLVSVSDTGSGIAPSREEDIFVPYYSTKPDGLGLGLSLSRSIIDAHGGRLWAAHQPERGAVFFFTLPARQDER